MNPTYLHNLFRILKELHFITEPEKLWRFVLEQCCDTLKAEGGSFYRVLESGRLELASGHGVDEERLRSVPIKLGTGFCGWSAEHKMPVLIDNAAADPRFNPLADQVTGVTTLSLLCVPVFSQEQTYGVMELINRRNGIFSEDDQEFATILSAQASVAYQNLLLHRETKQTKILLESLLGNMTGGLVAMDAEGNVTILNPAAKTLLGLTVQTPHGKPAAAILMDFPVLLGTLNKTLSTKAVVSREETLLQVQGHPTRFGYSTILINDPEQRTLGAGVIFQKLEVTQKA